MLDFDSNRIITDKRRTLLAVTRCGAINLFLVYVVLAPSTCSAEASKSLQKRKDAVFRLADRLGNLRFPSKSNVEKVIGCPVRSETAGRYSSEVDKSKDIECFLVPNDGELKVICTVLAINPKLDMSLNDVMRKYGKWKSTYKTGGVKEEKLEPSIVYRYNMGKMRMDFEFRRKNQKQLDSISIAPSTTPVMMRDF